MASCFACRGSNKVAPRDIAPPLILNLTEAKMREIGQLIQKNMSTWKKMLNAAVDLNIHVIVHPAFVCVMRQEGKVRVIVVNSELLLVQGTAKKVFDAFDWLEKKEFVFCAAKKAGEHKEVIFQRYLAEPIADFVPAIQQSLMALCPIPFDLGECEAYFTRKVTYTFKSLVEQQIKISDKVFDKMMKDVIDILYLLELKKVEHRDMSAGNFLVELGQETHVYLIDYERARTTVMPLAEKFVDIWDGFSHESPELIRYHEMGLDGVPNVKQKYMESWVKHDMWIAGLGLIAVKSFCTSSVDFRLNQLPYNILEKRANSHAITKATILNDNAFYRCFPNPSLISEPPAASSTHFIWSMLQYDHRARPTPTKLCRDFTDFLEL